jgi:hypothetical protein
MTDQNKLVTVYYVERVEYEGTMEYDDNSYYNTGTTAYRVSEYFGTEKEAKDRLEQMRSTATGWLNDDPFDSDGNEDELEEWTWDEHITMPYPVFCGWCEDKGFPRPGVDQWDDNGNVVHVLDAQQVIDVLSDDPPDYDAMKEWWDGYVMGHVADPLNTFSGIIRSAVPYQVVEETFNKRLYGEMVQLIELLRPAMQE